MDYGSTVTTELDGARPGRRPWEVLAEVGATEGANTAHHGLVSCGLLEGDGLLSLLLGDLELVTGGEDGGGETVQEVRPVGAGSVSGVSPLNHSGGIEGSGGTLHKSLHQASRAALGTKVPWSRLDRQKRPLGDL